MPSSKPAILCAGIAVQDIVFRVAEFPPPGGKCMTLEFLTVLGGCAVNAAVAVARLGGRAHYAGPLGGPTDNVSNQLMDGMAREVPRAGGVHDAHLASGLRTTRTGTSAAATMAARAEVELALG